jgi:MFS family permease
MSAEQVLSQKHPYPGLRAGSASNPAVKMVRAGPVASANAAVPSQGRSLSPAAAFFLLASITAAFLAGSSAPTPLYPLYQAQWGLSSVSITVIFGIYAVAVLAALLVAGRLSDHVGRRPVLIAAVVAQAVTMLMFAAADGLAVLLIARVIQGLATGAAVAAVGAGMLDINPARGTVANAVAPAMGTALGAVISGFMVHYLPAPTHLVYFAFGAVFILQGIGLLFMAETISPRAGALASLKPQFKMPPGVRQPLLLAIPALVAPWTLAGFYGSLGPSLMRTVFQLDSSLLGGVALFVLAGSGAISVLLLHRKSTRTMLTFGAAALLSGVLLVLTAVSLRSAALFFIGTAVAGTGFGAGFQGAVRSVIPLATPHERAGVLSVIFVVSYLSMGLPAIVAGYLVGQKGNLLLTAQEFVGVVTLLAALALWGALARRWKP